MARFMRFMCRGSYHHPRAGRADFVPFKVFGFSLSPAGGPQRWPRSAKFTQKKRLPSTTTPAFGHPS